MSQSPKSKPLGALRVFSARQMAQQLVPLAIGALCLWILFDKLATVDIDPILDACLAIPALNWVLAFAFTALSFLAIGQYDVIFHALLRTGVSAARARDAGIVSIAASQIIGFGLLSGTLARLRLLPELSPAQALRLSITVALSFLASWGVITALACLLLPSPAWTQLPSALTMVCALFALALILCQPLWHVLGRRIPWPTLGASLRLPLLVLADTSAAALALWMLVPSGIDLPFLALFPAYLLALGAALVTGTPGGVGPFEITLLTALPLVPEPALLSAILAYRVIYFALPGVLAGLALIAGPARPPRSPARDLPAFPAPSLLLDPEALLARSNGSTTLAGAHGTPLASVARAGHSLIALGAPLTPRTDRALPLALRQLAGGEFRAPVLYKCPARLAASARRQGWKVVPIASNAVLSPMTFTTEGPQARQLRRKLRSASKSGVRITQCLAPLPLSAMKTVSDDWSARNGGERGFSMGRFDPDHLARQQVLLAYSGDRLVAFVSFHHTARSWCLDLMRSSSDCPDGTMHALIVEAISVAARMRVARLSLAAVPAATRSRALHLLTSRMGGSGLSRFKACFAPRYEPLYLAAPRWSGLLIGGLDVARAILHPDRVIRPPH